MISQASPNRREVLWGLSAFAGHAALPQQLRPRTPEMLHQLHSPVLFAGDSNVAFRDPAALYENGWFYLYFTLIRREADGLSYSYVAWSRTRDLRRWSTPVTLTPRDKNLDFGSPGDVIRFGGAWILCLQTYPRPHGERYGNSQSRVWSMRSPNLRDWSQPQLLRVKGPDIPVADMGRMIDPFLLQDRLEARKWWCLYKQNGISKSFSYDLVNWVPDGRTEAGENPCVIVDRKEYVLFHSPPNGIGVKRSPDLNAWRDEATLTLGQAGWDWAAGRLTAGFVLDLRSNPRIGKALLFFHGSRFPEEDARGGFDNFASIGIAWSDDLRTWEWPGSDRVI